VLPDRHRRQSETLGKLRGAAGTLSFQEFGNGATSLSLARRLRFCAHAVISKEFSLQSQCSGVSFNLLKDFL
jgi:hypothetical protein